MVQLSVKKLHYVSQDTSNKPGLIMMISLIKEFLYNNITEIKLALG
ncbi:hypothetical protein HMPREF1230_0892 [Streptococcus pyogenes GA19681]|nr:hypothetical protein HMPREF1226_1388 [Streptococcus pyogenes UTMEM-1]EQL82076.1 hypothetical protein HMPREF1230_0892 [Streptococcus pyogenes GA19681]ESA47438.1 hypothetical protein HMPREF1233_2143 [Streptococcus pyogenes GA19700]KGE54168.1 hypothetical protein SPYAA472_1445 [Streptococcus pyogenes AA472]SDV81203.1 hypothetical protein ISR9_0328 [Streptococcus pyogenes]